MIYCAWHRDPSKDPKGTSHTICWLCRYLEDDPTSGRRRINSARREAKKTKYPWEGG